MYCMKQVKSGAKMSRQMHITFVQFFVILYLLFIVITCFFLLFYSFNIPRLNLISIIIVGYFSSSVFMINLISSCRIGAGPPDINRGPPSVWALLAPRFSEQSDTADAPT